MNRMPGATWSARLRRPRNPLFPAWLVALLALVAVSGPAGAALAGTLSILETARWARVEHVYDGDTFRTARGEKVRLLGINAPEITHGSEPGQPLGGAATRTLRALIAGKTVRLTFDRERRDTYGRLLAHVWRRDGLWVNGEMVRRGMAHAYPFVPNLREADKLLALEREARKNRRGIWATPRFAVLDAARISRANVGQFRLVRGRVTRLLGRGTGFRLGPLAVTIPRKYRSWFQFPLPLREGHMVVVHGVIRAGRKGGLYLALHSPFDLEPNP